MTLTQKELVEALANYVMNMNQESYQDFCTSAKGMVPDAEPFPFGRWGVEIQTIQLNLESLIDLVQIEVEKNQPKISKFVIEQINKDISSNS